MMKIKILLLLNIYLFAQASENDSLIEIDRYLRILNENPNVHEANLAVGNILYDSEKFSDAEVYFEKSTESNKLKLKHKSFYNLGNSQFEQGKYEESLDSYKKSIELFPNDLDSKYNYELAKMMVKKNKKNSDQNNSDDSKKDEQNKDQNESTNQGSNEDKEEEPRNQDSNDDKEEESKNQDSNEDKEEESRNQDSKEKNNDNTKRIDKKNEKISPNAESILNALKANENNLIRPQIDQNKSNTILKDW